MRKTMITLAFLSPTFSAEKSYNFTGKKMLTGALRLNQLPEATDDPN